jgi:flagellin FlaB
VDDGAEMGTGTLIVFIAVLVVAAWGVATVVQNVVQLQGASAVSAREASADVATSLRVLAAFGVRNSTSSDVWDIHLLTELPPGSSPLDVTRLQIRYSDGALAAAYTHSAAALPNGSGPSASFNATWILGQAGASFVMQPGDRVDLHLNLVSEELAPRTAFRLVVEPEKGVHPTVAATTPSTYGVLTVVPLAG